MFEHIPGLMEHLPEVLGPQGLPPDIPLICNPHGYDKAGFLGYPSRAGWKLNDIGRGGWERLHSDGTLNSQEEKEAFLQVWLFFGMLSEVLELCGVKIEATDFIRKEGGSNFITTASLPRYLDQCWDRTRDLSECALKDQFRKVTSCLQEGTRYILYLNPATWIPGVRHDPNIQLPQPLVLSLQVLAETLTNAMSLIFGAGDGTLVPQPTERNRILRPGRPSWCPSEKLMVWDFDTTSVWFANSIDRGAATMDHSSCGSNHCLARQTDESSYKTRHVDATCNCAHVQINLKDLFAIVRRGCVPRIDISETSDASAVALSVTESGPYIAISHVWSDGLGNTTGNSLPACQILRLKQFTTALTGQDQTTPEQNSALIWIDTLCVPLDPECRRLALDQLSNVYQNASHVLVLDESLYRTTYRCSIEERLVRICLSGWMRRLWTLQEGVLGRSRLQFQFLERAMALPSSGECLYSSVRSKAMSFICNYLPERVGNRMANSEPTLFRSMEVHPHINPVPSKDHQTSLNVTQFLVAIKYRSTSKRMDEAICLASLLHQDVAKVSVHKTADMRMKELIRLLGASHAKVPIHFVFSDEPKLRDLGYRWAPTSFLNISYQDDLELRDSMQDTRASFDHRGIYYCFRGYELDFLLGTLEAEIGVEVLDEETWYSVLPTHGRDFTREQHGEVWEAVRDYRATRVAIVVSPIDYGLRGWFGVIVSIYDQDLNPDGISTTLYARLLEKAFIKKRRPVDAMTVAMGKPIRGEQCWCIG